MITIHGVVRTSSDRCEISLTRDGIDYTIVGTQTQTETGIGIVNIQGPPETDRWLAKPGEYSKVATFAVDVFNGKELGFPFVCEEWRAGG